MTTLREAAQQALEALEKYRKMMFVEAGCRFGEGDSAITALRAALAEQPAGPDAEPVAHDEDLLERLYWEFDHQRKKTGEERMAFKGKMRFYASDFRRVSEGGAAFAQSVTDDMMNLADRLGSEYDDVDPKAWKHLLVYAPKPAEQEPVAAQHRFRHPQKGTPDWSVWQPCKVAQRPAWEVDSQGYEVEYRALYTAPQLRRRLTDEEIDNTTRKQVDDLLDHIYEYGTAAEGIIERVRAIARAIERAHGIGEQP